MATAPPLDDLWQSYNAERNHRRAEGEIAQRRVDELRRQAEKDGAVRRGEQ